MRRFFDRPDTRWRHLAGALHLYACPVPGSEVHRACSNATAGLRDVPALRAQPPEFVHMTLQRLDAYRDELSPAAWSALVRELGTACAGVEPFEVPFAAPTVQPYAIEAVGGALEPWRGLVSRLRMAITQAGLGQVLTDPPYGPHYTVAYSIDDVADEQVAAALAPVALPSRMRVETVSLVAVHQLPDAGYFAFETLHEWSLGRRAE